MRPNLADAEQTQADVGQIFAAFGQVRPKLCRIQQMWAQRDTEVVKTWVELGQVWAVFDQTWTVFGQLWVVFDPRCKRIFGLLHGECVAHSVSLYCMPFQPSPKDGDAAYTGNCHAQCPSGVFNDSHNISVSYQAIDHGGELKITCPEGYHGLVPLRCINGNITLNCGFENASRCDCQKVFVLGARSGGLCRHGLGRIWGELYAGLPMSRGRTGWKSAPPLALTARIWARIGATP